MSLSVFFLFVEAGGRIGDLLSFDLNLTGRFIGRMIGVIVVFSSASVFPNWVYDSSLFSARSTYIVVASVGLAVSSEALILLMKLSQSLSSNWIMVLTIVLYLLHEDLLR